MLSKLPPVPHTNPKLSIGPLLPCQFLFVNLFYYWNIIALLEKEMATYSSILTWRIPWAEEPGGLQSMGSPRVGLT